MQRFEYVAGTSAKFWAIERNGASVTTSWGRIGTTGQNKTKDFASDEAAQREEERLLREKTREGYNRVVVAKPAMPATSIASKVPTGPLTPIEMWELGQAIAGKTDRKISGRLDLGWGAGAWTDDQDRELGHGPSIPSKGGKLMVGNQQATHAAVTIAAAPGNGENALFTVYHRIGKRAADDGFAWGVRFAATAPVLWKMQKPIAITGTFVRAAVWTFGKKHVKIDFDRIRYASRVSTFMQAKDGSVLEADGALTAKAPLRWALGFDANGKAVCMLFGLQADLLNAVDDKPLAEPPADALAAMHLQPHRLALSLEQLRMLADLLQNSGPKARYQDDKWKQIDLAKHGRLALAGEPVAKVPSVKGRLCLGNLLTSKEAHELALGDHNNRAFAIVPDTGLGHFESLDLTGVTLSSKAPVRWKVEGEFAPGKPWPSDSSKRACIGLWSPGLDRSKPDRFSRNLFPGALPGRYAWYASTTSRLVWIVGYDTKDKPAAILVCDARATIYFEAGEA